MSLVQSNLAEKLEAHFNSMKTVEYENSAKANADGLAKIIHDYIISGTVTVPAGIPVKTEGSAVMQIGSTTQPVVTKVE